MTIDPLWAKTVFEQDRAASGKRMDEFIKRKHNPTPSNTKAEVQAILASIRQREPGEDDE